MDPLLCGGGDVGEMNGGNGIRDGEFRHLSSHTFKFQRQRQLRLRVRGLEASVWEEAL